MKRKYLFAIIYGIIISIITAFVLIKTFIIKEKYSTVSNYNTNKQTTQNVEAQITDNSYTTSDLSIKIDTIREYDTTVYIADITIKDVSLLKTAFAENTYGRNITEKTSTIAENNNSILAINGDYYGFRTTGFVIRNGQLYRETSSGSDDLAIYSDGSYKIVNESNTNAKQLINDGVIQLFSFGPTLVNNGEISVTENQEISGKSMVSNPRTAIGIIDNLHYIFVVSDGRTNSSSGLSLYQLAKIMQNYNCKIAYNLDGGGSSTMVFNNKVINNPTTNGQIKERSVSDIVYIGY